MRRRIGIATAAALVALQASAVQGQAQTYRERGAYLVNTLGACGNCHTRRNAAGEPDATLPLAGGFTFDSDAAHVVAPNITPDKETGISRWSDAQIVYALRNGKRPDGSIIGPPMPVEMYRGLSDRDAEAIAVYLKSLPPIRHAVPRSEYKIPLPPDYGPVVTRVAEPESANKIAYGAYLAGPVAHCMECHTPRVKGQLDLSRLGAGGRDFPDFGNPGALTVSRNITPAGIGAWSDADVKRAIVAGERWDGTKLSKTMPFAAYHGASWQDLNAIVDYLRTLKPVNGL